MVHIVLTFNALCDRIYFVKLCYFLDECSAFLCGILYEALLMRIFENDYYNENGRGCVLAFGNFDGVHNGHKHLLSKAKEYAREHGLDFGVYTFTDSPKFLNSRHSILTTLQSRLSLLDYVASPDFVYLEKFGNVKDMQTSEFVEYIINKFGCECGFCGENFRFGRNAVGDSSALVGLMSGFGKCAVVVPSLMHDGKVISSSRICALLKEGKVEEVNEMCEPYGFVSKVIHGAHLGNKLGYPTINQKIPHELICPKYGVYSTLVTVDGKEYMGVTNFGVKPTVSDDNTPVAETYIIGFDGDVYDKYVFIRFMMRLRDEKTFSSLDELTRNIAMNVEQTKKFFEENYETH